MQSLPHPLGQENGAKFLALPVKNGPLHAELKFRQNTTQGLKVETAKVSHFFLSVNVIVFHYAFFGLVAMCITHVP